MFGKKKQLPTTPAPTTQNTQNTIIQAPAAPVFVATQCVSPAFGKNYVEIDEKNKLWRIPTFPQFIFKYSDLLDYEIVQNGNTITKGGLGRAVVGGALFGGVGAIVGGATGKKKGREKITEYKIKVITSVRTCPLMYINLNAAGLYTDSPGFKACTQNADKITAMLSRIINEGKAAAADSQPPAPSSADEIMKYKQLLDAGAITQEEFESKKKQLLNL